MNLIKKYSQFIAIMPIIAVYASGVPGINIGELVLIVFLMIGIIQSFKSKKSYNIVSSMHLLSLVFYLIFAALLSVLINNDYSNMANIFIRTTRLSFYLIIVVFVSRKYFDFEIAVSTVKKVSVLGTIFITIQYLLFYGFNYILRGFVSFIPLYTLDYGTQNYALRYSQIYRPTSFFLEPAWFSYYAIVGLIIALFSKNELGKRDLSLAIIITIGIVLSTSAQGLFLALLVWFVWTYKIVSNKITLKKIMFFMMMLFIVPILLIQISQIDLVQSTIVRLTNTSEASAFEARFGGFKIINEIPLSLRIIGLGFGNVPDNTWLSSAAYMIYGGGFLGFIITTSLFMKSYFKSTNIISRLCTIVFYILFFGSAIFNNYMLVFYFSFICYSKKPEIVNERG